MRRVDLLVTRQWLRYRLRWYATATAGLVTRQRQWLIATILLLSYGPLVLLMLAAPIAATFSGRYGDAGTLLALILLLILALLWSGVQRANILGGTFGRYVQTLPIPAWQRLWVDVAVLLVADSLLFVPFILGAVQLAALPSAPINKSVGITALVLFLILLVVAQRYALYVTMPAANRLRVSRVANPAIHIELAALFNARLGTTLIRLTASFAIAAAALVLLAKTGFDARSKLIEVAALAMMAIIMSGSHRTLDALHAPVRPYLHSLPLPKHYWPPRDVLTVVLLAIVPGALVVGVIALAGVTSAEYGIAVGASYLLLVALLRFPQLHCGRHAVMGSAVMTVIWSVGAYWA